MNIVVSLNKQEGITSQEAAKKVKKLFKVRKAGYAGTLDPIASGILLVCLNEATKITPFLSDLDKEYIVKMKLGEKTDTYDSEGRIIEKKEITNIDIKDIEELLNKFVGEIDQVPPMYSAIKHAGKPLYKLARKGIIVDRKSRKVFIKSIDILEYNSPFLTLRISCSKGTYMRSLCNDIGEFLGVGAHMVGLIRTRIGNFSLDKAARFDEILEKRSCLYSIDDALSFLPEIILLGDQIRKVVHGNPVEIPEGITLEKDSLVRLKNLEDKLLGIGKVSDHYIKIKRLFNL
jgi:tRNA pseudouridine55 synthase